MTQKMAPAPSAGPDPSGNPERLPQDAGGFIPGNGLRPGHAPGLRRAP
jgi:hypothetical protein